MSLHRFSLRAFVLAWILAAALALLPLATVLADGGSTIYPPLRQCFPFVSTSSLGFVPFPPVPAGKLEPGRLSANPAPLSLARPAVRRRRRVGDAPPTSARLGLLASIGRLVLCPLLCAGWCVNRAEPLSAPGRCGSLALAGRVGPAVPSRPPLVECQRFVPLLVWPFVPTPAAGADKCFGIEPRERRGASRSWMI